ncbi:hypothetical protein [Candidatus Nitronereus thalassa]|uniref:Uncharacterized protein n=1 Tax=Candidatus Nitronereus thalassa TaxID=3020898 RepID=A0ABU3K9A5_9BACT|nr:hypothetical protein [Candidatus Nitronereus thalassa]MDT7042994.1 hypothetical protein [Candidatus Nitronereus thalassa]
MQGLSTLATIISVLAFPLIFLVLLYPYLAGPRGKWYAVCVYSGISLGMMLVAALTAQEPHLPEQAWGWWDWLVMILGVGLLLAYIARKYQFLKKEALARRSTGDNKKDSQVPGHRLGKKKRKL